MKLTCKLCISIVITLSVSSIAVAQATYEYYVSSSGSDSNPGTVELPLRTIQKCIDKWDDVNQVNCNCSGVFSEELVIRKSGPSPIMRNKIIAWDKDGDKKLSDEEFVLDGKREKSIAVTTPQTGTRPSNVEIAFVTFKNYVPKNGCGPKGDTQQVHFIKLKGTQNNPCSNWYIHDNIFTNLASNCDARESYIAIRPTHTPHLIIENNTFDSIGGYIMRYIHGTGISFINNTVKVIAAGIKAWGSPDSLQIDNNIFISDGNGFNPDTACGAQNVVNFSNNVQYGSIRNNLFVDCVTAIAIGSDNSFGLRDNAHHIIDGNLIYRSGRACNRYNSPIVIDDRSSYNKDGDSMHVHDVLISNNVIAYFGDSNWHRGAAIQLTSGHPYDFTNSIKLYHNTIVGYRWGIKAEQALVSSASPYSFQLSDIDIKNNIFYQIRESQYTLDDDGTWINSATPRNWVSDYNNFTTADNFAWNSNTGFQMWQASTNNDRNSSQCRPIFWHMDSDSSYRLLNTDHCAIDRGVEVKGVEYDRDGNSRISGKAPDLGTVEIAGNSGGMQLSSDINYISPASGRTYKGVVGLQLTNQVVNKTLHVNVEVVQRSLITINIFNIEGRSVTSASDVVIFPDTKSFTVDVSELKSGVYMLRVEGDGVYYRVPFVVTQ